MPESKITLPNARWLDDTVVTGGQPSEAELAGAAAAGATTVVNLRPAGEFSDYDEAERAAALGLRYVPVPVAGPGDINRNSAETLDRALAAADGPAIVHCASGNRVGALFAWRARHLQGREAETALRIGTEAGLDPRSPLHAATRRLLD